MGAARVRLAAVLLALVALAAGCGHSQHDAIAHYIDHVDTLETRLAGPLASVTRANRAFAKSQTSPRAAPQLAQAERTMLELRGELVALQAPPAASRLQTLLVQLVTREVSLTHELHELAVFVPRFEAALQPLADADATLKRELARTAKTAAAGRALDREKAAQLDGYAATVTRALAQLRPLAPPPVWRPGYDAELAALQRLRSAGQALAGALRSGDAASVPVLLHSFDAAAISNRTVAVQQRQIAAVHAYDARVRALARLEAEIGRERNRLQSTYQ